MLDDFKELTINQYHASLKTLDHCVDKCPDETWNAPINELAFCQAAFHALFFTDLYLGHDVGSQKTQPFHEKHANVFRDYEELQPRRQKLMYEQPWIKLYIEHCRNKVSQVIEGETEETLTADQVWWKRVTSRAESHIYNIRHVQHHAAQLILRLRLNHSLEMPWVSSGWDGK